MIDKGLDRLGARSSNGFALKRAAPLKASTVSNRISQERLPAATKDEVPLTNREAHQRNLRKGRFSQSGYCYFITTGTKKRVPVFADPAAAKIIMDCLQWLDEQARIDLAAAVVMPDHVHFVARLLTASLPSLMHSLKSFTSSKINELLGRAGPLWESQYHEHAIRTDDELLERVRYCLQNPVRKGLVSQLQEYPHWYCAYEL